MTIVLKNHGGQCCGARHLHNFGFQDKTKDQWKEEIKEASSGTLPGGMVALPYGRMVEIILNGSQVTTLPNLLEVLNDLGFVLSSAWYNHNHTPKTRNYQFTRCDDRLSLLSVPQWNGMGISPTLEGELPPRLGLGIGYKVKVNPDFPIEFEDGTPALFTRAENDHVVFLRAKREFSMRTIGNRRPLSDWESQNYYLLSNGVLEYDNRDCWFRVQNVMPVGTLVEFERGGISIRGTVTSTTLGKVYVDTWKAGIPRQECRIAVGGEIAAVQRHTTL
jgi:hypothetical protein